MIPWSQFLLIAEASEAAKKMVGAMSAEQMAKCRRAFDDAVAERAERRRRTVAQRADGEASLKAVVTAPPGAWSSSP